MTQHEITHFFSNEGSRNSVRMQVISMLSKEEPGTGTDSEASKYIYYVEKLQNGDRVYLKRPANLHNGFDFLVCVENTNYAKPGERRRNYPKHEDLRDDLEMKKEENLNMYSKMYDLLQKVYKCHDVSDEEMKEVHFNTGYSVDHILKTIKWLFIEQDIRYWNYSGRNMTWSIVPKK